MKAEWKSCPLHGVAEYCAKYDAAYCPGCDEWLETNCGAPPGPDCYYDCANRPAKPSMVDRSGVVQW